MLPPERCAGHAVFPVVRDQVRKGQLAELPDGLRVLYDDNSTPTDVFLWAADRIKGPDVQFDHVWNRSTDPECYTALWNLCCTPAFLAKTSDTLVVAALQYRAYNLYRALPKGVEPPIVPTGMKTWSGRSRRLHCGTSRSSSAHECRRLRGAEGRWPLGRSGGSTPMAPMRRSPCFAPRETAAFRPSTDPACAGFSGRKESYAFPRKRREGDAARPGSWSRGRVGGRAVGKPPPRVLAACRERPTLRGSLPIAGSPR